ncbi:hypothetical protein V8D89_014375 [Ganoderma adspersum]
MDQCHSPRKSNGSSVQYVKDPDFWYWDGNVVLAHGNTLFKLHASRLSTHSEYFCKLFAPGTRPTALAPSSVAQGCAMYPVPKEVSPTAFKYFLKTIETPWETAMNPPSAHLTNCLFFLARALACDLVLKLAKNSLRAIWDGHSPPSASSLTSNSNSGREHFVVAIHAMQFAREHSIPGVLKRMLYEVLSSSAFWRALDGVMSGNVSLPREVLGVLSMASRDQYRLVAAREMLRARWRDFIMQALEGMVEVYFRRNSGEIRKRRWWSFVFEKGGLEVVDPIRYDFIAEWGTELREEKKWFRACLERKRKAWEEKRVEWWGGMDGLRLFGL